jgi:hypothetical protein
LQQRLRRRPSRKRLAKKDSEARRIQELFASAARAKEQPNPLAGFLGNRVPTGDSFNNPAAWDTFARIALRLDGTDMVTLAMREAFKTFKLDPVDPSSWRILVSYFSFIFFAEYPRRKAGAPRTPAGQLKELLSEFEQVMNKDPRMSERKAARLLANKKKVGMEGLRKRLRKAKLIKL